MTSLLIIVLTVVMALVSMPSVRAEEAPTAHPVTITSSYTTGYERTFLDLTPTRVHCRQGCLRGERAGSIIALR